MQELTVNSIESFLQNNYIKGRDKIFRGVSDEKHKLISSIGREYWSTQGKDVDLLKEEDLDFPELERTLRIFDEREQEGLNLFRAEAQQFLGKPPENDLELMALGQHHGMATRLIDGSRNPLVALFFAVKKSLGVDGAVYVHTMDIQNDFLLGPARISGEPDFKVEQFKVYMPKVITPRISAQSGVFAIQPDPRVPVEFEKSAKGGFLKLIIAAKAKPEIYERLNQLGTHYKSLFPDLGGVAKWVRYIKHGNP